MKENNKYYHAAMYIRLSKEDGDKIESDSVSNQRDLIRAFIEQQEDIILYSERIDDGYSGVNFNRPAFLAMMEEIREKKVNCVIVKDLSRLGRNFIETGKYIENIFPFMGVRFISINDNLDSLQPRTSNSNLVVPVKNLMNDAYCRDISIKIRSQFEIKRKKGEYLGAFTAYGYLRDPQRKNKLIVDEIAAPVIQDIFRKKLEGMSADSIAKYLNEINVPSPAEHKRYLGLKFKTSFQMNATAKWTAAAVLRILKNPLYIGTLIQGKYTTPNYKVKKRICVPESKWICIENNHEAIIDKAIFDNVQELLKIHTRTAPKKEMIYPLSGLVICGDCRSHMIRKNNSTKDNPYYYYVCPKHKNGKGCTNHNIRDIELEKAVFIVLKKHIEAILDIEEMLCNIDRCSYTSWQVQKNNQKLQEKKKEYERYQKNKAQVYEDFKSGLLDQEEYEIYRKRYSEKAREVKKTIQRIEEEINSFIMGETEGQKWISYFKQYKTIDTLTRKMVVQLIEQVIVYEKKRIHIDFKFQFEYESALELIKSIEKIAISSKKEVM